MALREKIRKAFGGGRSSSTDFYTWVEINTMRIIILPKDTTLCLQVGLKARLLGPELVHYRLALFYFLRTVYNETFC